MTNTEDDCARCGYDEAFCTCHDDADEARIADEEAAERIRVEDGYLYGGDGPQRIA